VNAEARHGQLPVGPLVATIGAVLLIVSLFLDWYDDLSGFTVFEFLDLLLVMLALAMIASLASGVGLLRTGASPGLTFALALLALLVVISQIVNAPPVGHDRDQEIGIWLALGGSALMALGGLLGYAQISLAVEARPRPRPDAPAASDDEATTVTTPPPQDKGPERP
jgi:hypothetical protein